MRYISKFFGSFSFDKVIVAVDENSLIVKYCAITDAMPSITHDEAVSTSVNPSGSVFTGSDGNNYRIYSRRRIARSSWQCNENAFLLVGFQHDHPISIDFNRECEYLDLLFKDVESWCNNRSIYPVVAMTIMDKTKPFTENNIILFSKNRNIEHNLGANLENISYIDDFYTSHKLKVSVNVSQHDKLIITPSESISKLSILQNGLYKELAIDVNTSSVEIENTLPVKVYHNQMCLAILE